MKTPGTRSVIAALCAAAAFAGCAAAPRAESQSPAPSKAAQYREHGGKTATDDSAMPVLVLVDTGDRPLGAYELALRYDPAVVRVASVRSARDEMGDAAFGATPMSSPSTFGTGNTPIVGFVAGGPVRTGSIPVAVALVDAVKPGASALSVSVKALYDPDGVAIPGTARADPDSVHVNP